MRYRAAVCGAPVGWTNTGVSAPPAADIAQSCGVRAAVAFGNAGHRKPMLDNDLSAPLAISPAQWCNPLRRQHRGKLLAASANSGAASRKPSSTIIEMDNIRRIAALIIREIASETP